jgi:superfamily II DNA or RNA helicase
MTLDFRQNQTIALPKLIVGPIKYEIGEAWHLIRDEQKLEVVDISEIRVSQRVTEKALLLSNREQIIFTNRKKLALPVDVDGIIRILPDGKYEWMTHKKLQHAQSEIRGNGLKGIAKKSLLSWDGTFKFKAEKADENGAIPPGNEGLRPPQLGALYAIGSHWSLGHKPATVIMPTGTGKTETMLSALCAYQCAPLLVAVPTKALRDQTVRKFINLGLLKKFSLVSDGADYPVVGVIHRRPKKSAELKIFEDCNVLVGSVSSLSAGTAEDFSQEISQKCETLVLDEAHHIGARTWKKLRESFKEKKILQFTATPFREDGKLVDGDIIYNYPLRSAQEDGYFKRINFLPIHRLTQDEADDDIAKKSIDVLRRDIERGFNHILMARCSSIVRATKVLSVYRHIASDLNPVLIHSNLKDCEERIEEIKNGSRKVVICVDMLGEGFDLPELKVCALHDPHKSLAVVLQFTGRFTRSSGVNLGEASIIANIADTDLSASLERLYSEDSDWNYVLSEMSSQAAKEHARLIEFLNGSEVIESDDISEEDQISVSHHLLRPALSLLTYKSEKFQPKRFFEGLPAGYKVARVWLNSNENTLFFVTTSRDDVKWTRSKEIVETEWDLFILHYDSELSLLFLHSTNKSSNFEKMANAVGAGEQITGEIIFRCLGDIGRLIFQNLGVSKHGRRNLSYAMYTGADVKTALSLTETGGGSRKSNLSGSGWEQGKQITIGCSRKGRVWSKKAGTIPEFVDWAKNVGRKLNDETIDTAKIIENVLIPEEVQELPNLTIMGVEWPYEIHKYPEDRVFIKNGSKEIEVLLFELAAVRQDLAEKKVYFNLIHDDGDIWGKYYINLVPTEKFKVYGVDDNSKRLSIIIGSHEVPIRDFFNRPVAKIA